MTRLVYLRPEAESDLANARDWYEAKSSGLGTAFLDEAARAIRRLESEPDHTQLYYRNFRRVLLRRFPYKIFYQVMGNRVLVFRALHAKQEHTRGLGET